MSLSVASLLVFVLCSLQSGITNAKAADSLTGNFSDSFLDTEIMLEEGLSTNNYTSVF